MTTPQSPQPDVQERVTLEQCVAWLQFASSSYCAGIDYENPAAKEYLTAILAHLRAEPAAPPALSVPDVCVDNNGDISIEWYRDRRNLVSISTNGKEIWSAWCIDGETGSAGWKAEDATPAEVNTALSRLTDAGGQSL